VYLDPPESTQLRNWPPSGSAGWIAARSRAPCITVRRNWVNFSEATRPELEHRSGSDGTPWGRCARCGRL